MRAKQIKVVSIVCIISAALLMLFNNCSAEHDTNSSTVALGDGNNPWTCADQLDDVTLFQKTYHPFLTANCAGCHSGMGPGPGNFASSGPQLAFASFESLTFSKINTYAVNNHSPNATSSNTTAVSQISINYVYGLQAIEQCKANGGNIINEDQDGATRLQLRSIPVGLTENANAREIEWYFYDASRPANDPNNPRSLIINPEVQNLNLTDLSGVRLRATVQLFRRPGIIAYVLSNPRIITTDRDIIIDSLLFKVNGVPTPAQRAFYLTRQEIRAWNSSHPDFNKPDPNNQTNYNDYQRAAELISGGSLVLLGELNTTDVISVSIGELRRTTLGAPDLGPKIKFLRASDTYQEGYRIVDIPIVLDRPAPGGATAEVVFANGTTIKDECCSSTRNDDGQTINVDNFDRHIQDFDLIKLEPINRRISHNYGQNVGRYLIPFSTGDTTYNLRIKLVDNHRVEGNKVLRLQISSSSLKKLQADSSGQDYQLNIQENDTPRSYLAETYSELLSDDGNGNRGLLSAECLRCHNSVINRGGYDITNYEHMVSRGILIPGQPLESRMFIRMDSTIPGYLPMPETGFLSTSERAKVKNWIQLDGALNN